MRKNWVNVKLISILLLVLVVVLVIFFFLRNGGEPRVHGFGDSLEIFSDFEVTVLNLDNDQKILEILVSRGEKVYENKVMMALDILLEGESGASHTKREETKIEPNSEMIFVIDFSSSNIIKVLRISVTPVFKDTFTGEETYIPPLIVEKNQTSGEFLPKKSKSGGGGGGGSGGGGSAGGSQENQAACGNGILEENEECDEIITTNTCDTFGINPFTNGICTLSFCGDGTVQSTNGQGESEFCDKNSQSCVTNEGYSGVQNCNSECTQFLSCVTEEFCGDDVINGNEECDDGNNENGDGCDSNCVTEPGVSWACSNGLVEPNEVCDGNTETCTVNGYSGTQSCNSQCDGFEECVSTEYCGDDVINGNEECDGSDLGSYGNGVNQCSNYNQIYEGGDLSCSSGCEIDAGQCVNQVILVPQGLVGFWNFDGDTIDGSDSGNHGTIFGNPIYVNGKGGSALEFNGNGDYVDYGDFYDFTNTFSLVAWIYPKKIGAGLTSNSDRASTIMGKEMASNKQYFLEHSRNSKIRFYTFGTSSPPFLSSGKCNLNNWCHVVATWDGSTKKIYINGQLNSQVANAGTMIDNSDSFKVAYSRGTGNSHNYFNGTIDEARVYNRALTASEVQQLFNQF